MVKYLFFLFLNILMVKSQVVVGVVKTVDGVMISNAQVINMTSNSKTRTDALGKFEMSSRVGDEIRIVKVGFDRHSIIVTEENKQTEIVIYLRKEAQMIPELQIKYQATGNLLKDHSNFGEPKKVTAAKVDLQRYIKAKSSKEVYLPSPGEFRQPKSEGISLGSVDNQWDDFDLYREIISALGEDYFLNELGLQKSQLSSFIFAVFKDFSRKNILKYGRIEPSDLIRFQIQAEKVAKDFLETEKK